MDDNGFSRFDAAIRRTALTAKHLTAADGWVAYRVESDLQFGCLLQADEDEARHRAYFSEFYRDDPLTPSRCMRAHLTVARLADVEHGVAGRRYRRHFMQPFGLGDVVEMFVRDAAGQPTLGFSLLRNDCQAGFSLASIRALGEFQGLAETLFSHLDAAQPDRSVRVRLARRFPQLSPRELDVASAVVDGLANKSVAAREQMSLATVKTHLLGIFRKCGIKSRSELGRCLIG